MVHKEREVVQANNVVLLYEVTRLHQFFRSEHWGPRQNVRDAVRRGLLKLHSSGAEMITALKLSLENSTGPVNETLTQVALVQAHCGVGRSVPLSVTSPTPWTAPPSSTPSSSNAPSASVPPASPAPTAKKLPVCSKTRSRKK